jgi:hypothetical protein
MLGVLENFGQVFNLDKWKKVKTGYLIKKLGDKEDPYIREIREYAKSEGYLFNPWHMVVSEILNFKIGSAGVSLSKFLKVFHDHFTLH